MAKIFIKKDEYNIIIMISNKPKTNVIIRDELEIPFYDVFVSYSHKDVKWVKKFSTDLTNCGFDVFFDEWSIPLGQDIPIAIESALDKSNKILAIISSESLESEWTEFERKYNWKDIYLKNKNKLIPIIIKKCDLPENIARLKYLDFTNRPYSKNLKVLIDDLKCVSRLEFGLFRLKNLNHSSLYLEFIIKKINLYFPGHKIDVIQLVYNELISNAFEHVENPIVYVDITATEDFVGICVEDNGKGFNILKTVLENKSLLEEDPTIIKKRGLVLVYDNCNFLENSISKSSHMVKALIRKYINVINFRKYNRLFAYDRFAGYTSPSKKISFLRASGPIDIPGSELFKKALYQIINPGINKYLLDLSEVVFMGSSAIGKIAIFFKNLCGVFKGYKNFKVSIVAKGNFADLFASAKLDKIIYISDSIDKANEYLLNDRLHLLDPIDSL